MPEMAPDITVDELDKEVLEELRSLPGDLAILVGRHLVAAERALQDDDPEQAYEHTKVARRFAARIGVVREAAGIVAYHAGHYSEALSDLRAARRMTGSDAYLPIMADCERGLGRPERAIDLVRSPEAERLDRAGRIELTIVESGARRDLGQHDAAVITLQRLPELRDPRPSRGRRGWRSRTRTRWPTPGTRTRPSTGSGRRWRSTRTGRPTRPSGTPS
ncbi:tetratricopeptide repeat protein [Nonomuraea antimicrobica]